MVLYSAIPAFIIITGLTAAAFNTTSSSIRLSLPIEFKQSNKASPPARLLGMTTSQPIPAPPSSEERRLYYYSLLPSCAPLVARSSTYVWENPQKPGSVMYPTRLRFGRRDTPFFFKYGKIMNLVL